MKRRIEIGAQVKSVNPNGQVKATGTLVALFHAEYWLTQCSKHDPDFIWKLNYPTWKQKPVAVVWYDDPQRTATLEEWVRDGVHKGFTEESCNESYEKDCPIVHQMCFPFDDLQLA